MDIVFDADELDELGGPTTGRRTSCLAQIHGTVSAYTSFGCRCLDAALLAAVTRPTPPQLAVAPVCAVGTARRIGVLIDSGWLRNQLLVPLWLDDIAQL